MSQGQAGKKNVAIVEAAIVLLALGLALAVGVGGFLVGRSTASDSTPAGAETTAGAGGGIALAPAFDAEELAAEPTGNWPTNGGSLANQRYSPLDQITTDNVGQLKGVWHVDLGSAVAAKYSAESQPIVYEGVLYVSTGEDDVFAIDVKSGKKLWTYDSKIDNKISTVCCGWLSRGVAIGDGKVYIGQLDGKLVALDQQTGAVAWSTQVARWQDGYTITAAPLYYNGKVYTGVAGGEYGIRGRMTALDAGTGKELWRFYTTPGPGEVGHDTWEGDSWKTGGASIWQTPSVDPELGLLYFSTGNAAPDFIGAHRAGDNLFAASMVAIDAETGKYRWHFQQVHHDIWDYDAPSPTVLFDAEIGGETRHGIAEVGKTGWAYILDRETGEPLIGIEERPVPQEPSMHTAKTQPFPAGDSTVPHSITPGEFAALQKALKKVKLVNNGQIFTPYAKGKPALANPGTLGGTNWFPSSFNPKTNYLYVCGVAQTALFTGGNEVNVDEKGKYMLGSAFVPAGKATGTFTAVDIRTNRIAWQKQWPESCYSGSATTAGNIVFVGRNNGELQALDARDGTELWSFQTGAGANNVPTIFEQDGTQYVAFYAGGNALGGTAHGDELWLFSLDGTLGPATTTGRSGGVLHAGEKPDVAAGQKLYADNCATCHGNLGQGGNGGPDLQNRPGSRELAHVVDQVANGGNGMPPFKDALSEKEIADVSAFVTTKISKKGGAGQSGNP